MRCVPVVGAQGDNDITVRAQIQFIAVAKEFRHAGERARESGFHGNEFGRARQPGAGGDGAFRVRIWLRV